MSNNLIRYHKITEKNPREIVLLKAFPCVWGKCKFCDYTLDNSLNREEINSQNEKVLSQVTGELKVLEVINSGSCFELPIETLQKIKEIILQKNIQRLFLESHWLYRERLNEMREFFQIPITFKIGVETFDFHFREVVLRKNANFQSAQEVAAYFDSPCLLVGMKGQTKEMIAEDIRLLKQYFALGTVNVYTNNTTEIVRDEELIHWFKETYHWLNEDPSVEVLYENTDFGVG